MVIQEHAVWSRISSNARASHHWYNHNVCRFFKLQLGRLVLRHNKILEKSEFLSLCLIFWQLTALHKHTKSLSKANRKIKHFQVNFDCILSLKIHLGFKALHSIMWQLYAPGGQNKEEILTVSLFCFWIPSPAERAI